MKAAWIFLKSWLCFCFSVARGTVILTSHFETDIVIHADYTMLSLIAVFCELSFRFLTFCQYLNCALLQSCHQTFTFECQFMLNISKALLDVCLSAFCTRYILLCSFYFKILFHTYCLHEPVKLCLNPEIDDIYWQGGYLLDVHDDLGLAK